MHNKRVKLPRIEEIIVSIGLLRSDVQWVIDWRNCFREYLSDWRRQGARWGVYAKNARWKRRERRRACIKSATEGVRAWGEEIEKLGDVTAETVVTFRTLSRTMGKDRPWAPWAKADKVFDRWRR